MKLLPPPSLSRNAVDISWAQNVSQLLERPSGTFTCAAAATTVVTESRIRGATSRVILVPTNAAAATLMSNPASLYVSAVTGSTSFTVATASGGVAAGTETFWYEIVQ
jgi:hypothetical protein